MTRTPPRHDWVAADPGASAARPETRSRRSPAVPAGRSPGQPGPVLFTFTRATLRAGNGPALRQLNWTWRVGEQWAVLGANGSGKSLLTQALRGELVPTTGELTGPLTELDPLTAVSVVSPQAQRQLVLHQSPFLQARWHGGAGDGQPTVSQFLSREAVEERNPFEVGPRPAAPGFAARQRHWARVLGLASLWDRPLLHLSNGEQRRTLLARAILRAPRLLILDDPFVGLDVATREHLRPVLAQLMRDGLPVLVLTHRPEDLPAAATHVLWVAAQRVRAQGPRAAVLERAGAAWMTGHIPADGVGPGRRPAGGRVGRRGFPKRQPAGAPVVELRRITIPGGRRPILRDVTWTVRSGEHWALLGPNGAGKTTLLSLIQGDHPQAWAQDVRLFGHRPDSTQTLWELRQRIGSVSPELHLHHPTDSPCLDVVCSGFFGSLGLYEPCTRQQRARARKVLAELGLASRAARPLGELSTGEQRLALLARALVRAPRLLILDEVCQGVDEVHRHALFRAVERLARSGDRSVLFVTHRADEIPACLTHVLELRAGRVLRAEPWRP